MSRSPLRHLLLVLLAVLLCSGSDCGTSTTPDDEVSYRVYPALIYPPEKPSSPQSRTPTFVWHQIEDVEHFTSVYFTVFVSEQDGPGRLEFPAGTDTVLVCPELLEENTKYRWHVKSRTIPRDGASSSYRWFTTGSDFNNPPAEPFDHYPPFELPVIYYDPGVVCAWDCFDLDGDELAYDFWIIDNYDGSSGGDAVRAATGLTAKQFTPQLEYDNRYHWWVTAFDVHGDSTSSRHRGWSIDTPRPSSPYPPSNPYPEDGSQRHLTDLTLSWTCNDPDGDPLTYDVYFGLVNFSLNPPLIAPGLTNNSLDISGLEYGSRYMWHVTAEDPDGHRTDGPLWIFDTISEDPGEDLVYAELTVHRSQTSSGTDITRIDHVSARFDSLYAPDGPIHPLRPESVAVNIQGGPLEWDDTWSWYYYANIFNGWFLAPGAEYVFTITGGDGVPSLVTNPIVLPECRPYIMSPEPFSSVTLEGLEVVWTGYDTYADCDRPVTIRIKDMGPIEWTDVFITTENDGSYTFTASDVSGIDPFGYQFQITLIIDNKELIDAPGYDPRSWIWARTYATQFVYTN